MQASHAGSNKLRSRSGVGSLTGTVANHKACNMPMHATPGPRLNGTQEHWTLQCNIHMNGLAVPHALHPNTCSPWSLGRSICEASQLWGTAHSFLLHPMPGAAFHTNWQQLY